MATRKGSAPATAGFEMPDPWADEEPMDLTPVAYAPVRDLKMGMPHGVAPIDLTGRTTVRFLRARGRAGKTLFARWMVETVANVGGRMAAVSLDPGGNTSLAHYAEGVRSPPAGDPAVAVRFLEALVQHAIRQKVSALVDTRGEDTSFGALVAGMPTLVEMMRGREVEPVGIYLLGPDPEDLKVLAGDVGAGFAPPCTLLVHNYGLVDPTADQKTAFGRVERHPVHKAAVERKAVVVEMPRLLSDTMAKVNGRRLHLLEAAEVEGGLDPFDAGRVAHWLREMGEEFAPVRSWVAA